MAYPISLCAVFSQVEVPSDLKHPLTLVPTSDLRQEEVRVLTRKGSDASTKLRTDGFVSLAPPCVLRRYREPGQKETLSEIPHSSPFFDPPDIVSLRSPIKLLTTSSGVLTGALVISVTIMDTQLD